MVYGAVMNHSQQILDLLEGKASFIINVRAVDGSAAINKIFLNRGSYKGWNLLIQKEEVISFTDNLKRPLGQLLDVIRKLINEDPFISDVDGNQAGVMEIIPGDFIFFGCGRT
jgi:hypothetical protein